MKTPLTDAAEFFATTEKPSSGDYELVVVYAEFARELEKENAALRTKVKLQQDLIATYEAKRVVDRAESDRVLGRHSALWVALQEIKIESANDIGEDGVPSSIFDIADSALRAND